VKGQGLPGKTPGATDCPSLGKLNAHELLNGQHPISVGIDPKPLRRKHERCDGKKSEHNLLEGLLYNDKQYSLIPWYGGCVSWEQHSMEHGEVFE
jgi:hypothetical protein